MAYVATDEEDQKNAPAATAPVYGGATAPSAAPAGATSSAPAAASSQPQTQTGYTNFDRFLAANRDAGQQLVQGVTGGIQKSVQGARDARDQAVSAYNQQVDSQVPVYDPNASIRRTTAAAGKPQTKFGAPALAQNPFAAAANGIAGVARAAGKVAGSGYAPQADLYPSTYDPKRAPWDSSRLVPIAQGQILHSAMNPGFTDGGLVRAAAAKATSPAASSVGGVYDPNKLSSAQATSLANQQYTGPTALDRSALSAGYADAATRVDQLSSDAGRQALLADYTGRQTADPYDVALMSGAGGNVFDNLKQQFAGVGDELGAADQAAADRATAKQQQYANADANYQSLLDKFMAQEKLRTGQ